MMMRQEKTNHSPWWREAVIYQIYPRSFMDSNGDGVGDLPGITEKLDYIAKLGVDIIWISPFFTSPMKDFGYDVANYCDVDPLFGTLQNFDELISKAHQLGLKVIIDQVLSHTAETHPWFIESRSSRNNAKSNWYVWADPLADGTPPNNWLSIFGGSAWQWDTRRCQYYLHNFLTSQPDMNFHHQEVQDAHLNNMRFWLERGVDGFRLDACIYHFHDQQLRNNPVAEKQNTVNVSASNPYGMQAHIYDNTRPENLLFLEQVRTLLDEYHAISIGEVGSDDALGVMAEYTQGNKRLHMSYSFNLLTAEFSAQHIRQQVSAFEEKVSRSGGGGASWSVGNHDVARVMSRWGGNQASNEFAKLILAMQLSLKGIPCLYQGDELGLTEAEIAYDEIQDPVGKTFWPESKGRDGCRTPMPWNAQLLNAGFSTSKPWLPIMPEHQEKAVTQQEQDTDSVLQFARNIIWWRKSVPQLMRGEIIFYEMTEPILVFKRSLKDYPDVLCVFNLGNENIDFVCQEALGMSALAGHGLQGSQQGDRIYLPSYGAWFGQCMV